MKLPPSFDSKIGWRVEFRTMEIQLTDDENIAFSILTEVLVRMLYEDWFGLNFYIPMDKVDANFERSKIRDAITL
jgi:glutamate--cysteine ligase catalytic subunit